MEYWQRQIIKENLAGLIESVHCTAVFLAKLQCNELLSDEEVSSLTTLSEEREKSRRLLEIIQTRSNSFLILKQVLREQSQTGALALLKNDRKQEPILHINPQYDRSKPLGKPNGPCKVFEGTFGSMPIAVKVRSDSNEHTIMERIKKSELSRKACENIVRYFFASQQDDSLVIFMELCHFNLKECIEKEIEISPRSVMNQIAKSVEYIHHPKCGIVHLDIRPENFLVSYKSPFNFTVKLSSFKQAKCTIEKEEVDFTVLSHTPVDVLSWRAPEIQLQDDDIRHTKVTKAADIFALGCLFYYVITNGKHPYGLSYQRAANIVDNKTKLQIKYFKSKYFSDFSLIKTMLKHTSTARPSIDDVLKNLCFWNARKMLRFINDAVHVTNQDDKGAKQLWCEYLESFKNADNISIKTVEWLGYLCVAVREYMFTNMLPKIERVSVEHLFKAITYFYDNFLLLPPEVKTNLGRSSEEFLEYWTRRFPIAWIYFFKMRDTFRLKEYYSISCQIQDIEDIKLSIDQQLFEKMTIENVLETCRELCRFESCETNIDPESVRYNKDVIAILKKEHSYQLQTRLRNKNELDPEVVFKIQEEETMKAKSLSVKLVAGTPLASRKFYEPMNEALRDNIRPVKRKTSGDSPVRKKGIKTLDDIVKNASCQLDAQLASLYPFESQAGLETDLVYYEDSEFIETLKILTAKIKFAFIDHDQQNHKLTERLDSALQFVNEKYLHTNLQNKQKLDAVIKSKSAELVNEYTKAKMNKPSDEAQALHVFYQAKFQEALKRVLGSKIESKKLQHEYLQEFLEACDNTVNRTGLGIENSVNTTSLHVHGEEASPKAHMPPKNERLSTNMNSSTAKPHAQTNKEEDRQNAEKYEQDVGLHSRMRQQQDNLQVYVKHFNDLLSKEFPLATNTHRNVPIFYELKHLQLKINEIKDIVVEKFADDFPALDDDEKQNILHKLRETFYKIETDRIALNSYNRDQKIDLALKYIRKIKAEYECSMLKKIRNLPVTCFEIPTKLHELVVQGVINKWRHSKVAADIFKLQLESKLTEEIEAAYASIKLNYYQSVADANLPSHCSAADCIAEYNKRMGEEITSQTNIDAVKLQKIHETAKEICFSYSQNHGILVTKHILNFRMTLESNFLRWKAVNDIRMLPDDVIIGIDFGNSSMRMAVYHKGKTFMIPNFYGFDYISCIQSYNSDGSTSVGVLARDTVDENPHITIFGVKPKFGRISNDSILHNFENWGFSIAIGKSNSKIPERLTPEDVITKIFQDIKQTSDKYLNKDVRKAVITIPPWLSGTQRKTIIKAAKKSGLKPLGWTTDTEAAALHFATQNVEAFGRAKSNKINILIFDLGEQTLKLAVVLKRDNILDMLAVNGDTHLGGHDLDCMLAEHCLKIFQSQTGTNLMEKAGNCHSTTRVYSQMFFRLLRACEVAKICLSTEYSAEVCMKGIISKQDLRVNVTRDEFEQLNKLFFNKISSKVLEVVQMAKLHLFQIDQVGLAGGCSSIPKIKEIVQDLFGNIPIQMTNPAEVVAQGAALYTAKFSSIIEPGNWLVLSKESNE